MKASLRSFALAFLLCGSAWAQVPETPAGRQFSAWLDSFNTGDRATMLEFFEANGLGGLTDQSLSIYANTGGYDVRRVQESSDTRLTVLAQARAGAQQFVAIVVNVDAAEPHRMLGIRINAAQPPPDLAPPPLTEAEIAAAREGAPYAQFSRYLETFNSGDREAFGAFLQASWPTANLDNQMNFRGRTGGLELRKLERATDTVLVGLVQERDSDQFGRFTLVIEPADPHRITQLGIQAIPRPADFPVARLSDDDVIAELEARLERDAAADRFAGTVLVARDGEVLFSEAYGLADREANQPNTLDTQFRIGSMNKMFTAVSVLQLVQAGKIRLDATVSEYIPDYPNRDVADKVTIHHLLTHTGGTGDIFGPEYNARRTEIRTHDDYVALYGNRAPLFPPGSRYMYSNYGMVLLGAIIEHVSGQSYYDYVTEHVYEPAGMSLSGSEPESVDVPGRAVGYTRQQGSPAWSSTADSLGYRGSAAGGGYSTVGDLLKFAEALFDHKLLDAEHTELLITGKVESGGAMYAYGFADMRQDGEGAVGHSGGAPGMSGDLRIYPQTGHVVAVLSNLDPPAAPQISGFVDLRLER